MLKKANIMTLPDLKYKPKTPSNVTLVTGFSGSGKSTVASKLEKKSPKNVLIELDGFEHDYDTSEKEKLVKKFTKKHGLYTKDNKNVTNKDILEYLFDAAEKKPDKNFIIEGVQLLGIPDDIIKKHNVIVKGTGLLRSSANRAKRDKGNGESFVSGMKYNLKLNDEMDRLRSSISGEGDKRMRFKAVRDGKDHQNKKASEVLDEMFMEKTAEGERQNKGLLGVGAGTAAGALAGGGIGAARAYPEAMKARRAAKEDIDDWKQIAKSYQEISEDFNSKADASRAAGKEDWVAEGYETFRDSWGRMRDEAQSRSDNLIKETDPLKKMLPQGKKGALIGAGLAGAAGLGLHAYNKYKEKTASEVLDEMFMKKTAISPGGAYAGMFAGAFGGAALGGAAGSRYAKKHGVDKYKYDDASQQAYDDKYNEAYESILKLHPRGEVGLTPEQKAYMDFIASDAASATSEQAYNDLINADPEYKAHMKQIDKKLLSGMGIGAIGGTVAGALLPGAIGRAIRKSASDDTSATDTLNQMFLEKTAGLKAIQKHLDGMPGIGIMTAAGALGGGAMGYGPGKKKANSEYSDARSNSPYGHPDSSSAYYDTYKDTLRQELSSGADDYEAHNSADLEASSAAADEEMRFLKENPGYTDYLQKSHKESRKEIGKSMAKGTGMGALVGAGVGALAHKLADDTSATDTLNQMFLEKTAENPILVAPLKDRIQTAAATSDIETLRLLSEDGNEAVRTAVSQNPTWALEMSIAEGLRAEEVMESGEVLDEEIQVPDLPEDEESEIQEAPIEPDDEDIGTEEELDAMDNLISSFGADEEVADLNDELTAQYQPDPVEDDEDYYNA